MPQANVDIANEAGPSESSDAPDASLTSRARATIDQGMLELERELQDLEARGQITRNGELLVAWPDDMRPGSKTDL